MLLLFLVSLCSAQPWNLPLATFPAGSPWTLDVSNAPLDPNSANIIARLGSFGTNPIKFDVSFQPLYSNCATPRVPFVKAATYSSECTNPPPAFIPLPNTGGEIHSSSIIQERQSRSGASVGSFFVPIFFFFFFPLHFQLELCVPAACQRGAEHENMLTQIRIVFPFHSRLSVSIQQSRGSIRGPRASDVRPTHRYLTATSLCWMTVECCMTVTAAMSLSMAQENQPS